MSLILQDKCNIEIFLSPGLSVGVYDVMYTRKMVLNEMVVYTS